MQKAGICVHDGQLSHALQLPSAVSFPLKGLYVVVAGISNSFDIFQSHKLLSLFGEQFSGCRNACRRSYLAMVRVRKFSSPDWRMHSHCTKQAVTADTSEYINDTYSLAMFRHILNMELHGQFTHIEYPIYHFSMNLHGLHMF